MSRRPDALKEEVYCLASGALSADLTAEEALQLERLVTQDPRARRFYYEFVCDACNLRACADRNTNMPTESDARIAAIPQVSPTAAPPAPVSPVHGFPLDVQQQGWGFLFNHLVLFSFVGLLIAASVAGVIASRTISRPPAQLASATVTNPPPTNVAAADSRQAATPPANSAASSPRAVARIGRVTDCHWTNSGAVLATGARLQPGREIDITKGQVEIVFDCEVVVTLYGPSILLVKSDKQVQLLMGHAMARADTRRGHGFAISTRTATAFDLGTEFDVQAAPDGHSEVYVTRGAVEVQSHNSTGRQRLEAGQTAQVEPGDAGIITVIEGGSNTPDFKFPTIEPPSKDDYADRSQHHASIRVVQGQLDIHSGPIELLLDGRGQSTKDAPRESVFVADNTKHGRILLDLGKIVLVHKVNTYSWHVYEDVEAGSARRDSRATQRYTLYGCAGNVPPPPDGDPATRGWKLISRVNTDEAFTVPPVKNRPPQQAVSTTGTNGKIGQYRFLLWDVEPTHVDAYSPPLQSKGPSVADRPGWLTPQDESTFFGEFDVYAE
jgi:hypothetical protein